ncbi:MAG TPA: DUF1775 domain-containing protein [Vicinamibacterales bacterium]|nr:DUF1775 domain-containing protein [Vicinamibacterales bacterium]
MTAARIRASLGAALVLLAAATAHAHVTVAPESSRGGAVERYTMRVPTEGQVTTVSVELEVPADVTITSVLVTGGFTYEARREGNRIVAITWTMDVKPAEVAEFVFFARNPASGQIRWKARQKFADGTTADWVGVEGDRRPAAVTKLTAGR